MNRILAAALAAALALACATAPAPARPRPVPRPAQPPSAPSSAPNALHLLAEAPPSVAAPVVRVGLASDQLSADFGRIDGGYAIVAGNEAWGLARGFTVRAPVESSSLKFAIQVGAISDRGSADKFALRANADSGLRADLSFDTATAVYKVLVGEFSDESSAQPARSALIGKGYPKEIFVVRRPSDLKFDKVIRLIDDEGDEHRFAADSILVVPLKSGTIAIAGKLYRGGARVFLNSRGTLNLIDELNLEQYVRGVVPNEMGPNVFDAIEALKAQAIAARTYVVARRGEYAGEGYDICATPSCQVYGGFSTEHPLASKAVEETAGLVITYDGKPIDALYTSTCGGETSDVGVMFPGRNEPYLKRARCVELELVEIAGRRDGAPVDEAGFRAEVLRTLAFPAPGDLSGAWSGREIAHVTAQVARIGGLTLHAQTPPASSRRRDVLEYLGRALGLADAAKVLIYPEDRQYLFPRAAAEDAAGIASLLVKFEAATMLDWDAKDLGAAMPREELLALLYGWLRQFGAFGESSGTITVVAGRRVTIKGKEREESFVLPDGALVFRKLNDRYREGARVPVQVGDRASLVMRGRTPVALVVQANFDGAAYDNRSSFSSWVRSFRAEDLVASISRRNLISKLEGLRIVGRDAAQRVTALEVIADGGKKLRLEGLPIRWSLGVPDNLFVFEVTRDADGTDRYTFFGKGWGHGVGFCQHGSQGMALRGRKAEEILKHYYTGVEIVPISTVAPR